MSVVAKTKAVPKAAGQNVLQLPHTKDRGSASTQPSEVPLRAWRRKTGLNRRTFAQISHISERSLASYEKAVQVPTAVPPQVTEARRLVEALGNIIPAGELMDWLETPNPGFGGRTPQELNDSGERDLLWEMIHQTRHGAFA